jgi:hypothetical protein
MPAPRRRPVHPELAHRPRELTAHAVDAITGNALFVIGNNLLLPPL